MRLPPQEPRQPKRANLGKTWEKVLCVQHTRYERDGLAHIEKLETPSQPLEAPRDRTFSESKRYGKGGPVVLCRPIKGKHVDFAGILRGGRAVRLEAKHRSENRVRLDAIEPHQARALNLCDQLGGFSAVLVLLPSGLWVIPWLHWLPSGTKMSLNPADLDARGARLGDERQAALIATWSGRGGAPQVDWLTAATREGWT